MRRPSLLLGALLLSAPACGDDASGPEGFVIPLASGVYDGQPVVNSNTVGFPHEASTDFEMTVDRDAGIVTIRYPRRGSVVVEFWRITGVSRR